MQFEDFVGQVQDRAQLASQGEAMRAVHATLVTLGERLCGGEASQLADQLPREIGFYLRHAKPHGRFDLEDFFKRISDREGISTEAAVNHAYAVFSVLIEAVSPGEIEDVLAQLPREFNQLFGARPPEKSYALETNA